MTLFYWLIYVLVPLVFFIQLWRGKFTSRRAWTLYTVMAGLFIAYLFLVGRWDVVGYFPRILIVVMFLTAAVRSFFKNRDLARRGPRKSWKYRFNLITYTALSLYFGAFVLLALWGMSDREKPVHLHFPLQSGVYHVVHGGSTTAINYHHTHRAQAYALDMVKLNRAGMRANHLSPESLRQFVIYQDPLYSPCSGEVIQAVDGLKELEPFEMNRDTQSYRQQHPTGNHVRIGCKGVEVVIAHLVPGSLQVEKGQRIEAGDPIGRVGNSGNTSEPHLHIHAEKNGQGVPIRFGGRFLIRNSLVFSR